ncbi:hypothetical protein ADUPG1_009984 [Aduncisulcus paluster]|uniref:EGF-like domain-containing protein n=1 Tax=Aduncisulcus paluster TaxID=2918883 RepID=A0ABQ5KZK0_9EUKA|nr:hypothetical protein ADUPG1_009984 [Aduncisulcus paluster]
MSVKANSACEYFRNFTDWTGGPIVDGKKGYYEHSANFSITSEIAAELTGENTRITPISGSDTVLIQNMNLFALMTINSTAITINNIVIPDELAAIDSILAIPHHGSLYLFWYNPPVDEASEGHNLFYRKEISSLMDSSITWDSYSLIDDGSAEISVNYSSFSFYNGGSDPSSAVIIIPSSDNTSFYLIRMDTVSVEGPYAVVDSSDNPHACSDNLYIIPTPENSNSVFFMCDIPGKTVFGEFFISSGAATFWSGEGLDIGSSIVSSSSDGFLLTVTSSNVLSKIFSDIDTNDAVGDQESYAPSDTGFDSDFLISSVSLGHVCDGIFLYVPIVSGDPLDSIEYLPQVNVMKFSHQVDDATYCVNGTLDTVGIFCSCDEGYQYDSIGSCSLPKCVDCSHGYCTIVAETGSAECQCDNATWVTDATGSCSVTNVPGCGQATDPSSHGSPHMDRDGTNECQCDYSWDNLGDGTCCTNPLCLDLDSCSTVDGTLHGSCIYGVDPSSTSTDNVQYCSCFTGWETDNCSYGNCMKDDPVAFTPFYDIPFTGALRTIVNEDDEICSYNGTCNHETSECECDDPNNWIGSYCSEPTCYSYMIGAETCYHCDCMGGNGQCVGDPSQAAGHCECVDGWTGDHCQEAICSEGCINGTCDAPDTCQCSSTDWSGDDCSYPTCVSLGDCVHGVCSSNEDNTQMCVCDKGYKGTLCDAKKVSASTIAVIVLSCLVVIGIICVVACCKCGKSDDPLSGSEWQKLDTKRVDKYSSPTYSSSSARSADLYSGSYKINSKR